MKNHFKKKPMCETNICLHDLIDICRAHILREVTFTIDKRGDDINDEFIDYISRQDRIIDKLNRLGHGIKLSDESIHTCVFGINNLAEPIAFNNRFYIKRIKKN